MKYTADYIYTPEGFVTNYLIESNENGTITAFRPMETGEDALFCEGILCPGFVNAHCHLELSALRGLVPEHTGMTGFAGHVVGKRKNISPEDNSIAIQKALQEMWESGTQAVGDICNEGTTAPFKRNFPALFCYNFVEIFGMRENMAETIWEKGLSLLPFFEGENQRANLTLHAPYSLSLALREKAKNYFSQAKNKVVSIHLLESKAEREIFEAKTGDFATFYQQIGIDFQGFSSKSPIEYVLSPFESSQNLLLVHNTEITKTEIDDILAHFPNTFFCLCPRSNLFIHNTFPDISLFLKYKNRVCLGTDSLASNHSLEMLAEIYVIQQRFPSIDLHTLLTWLISNGAAALKQSHHLGHFEIGKNAGIIHIQGVEGLRMTEKSRAIRII